MTMVEGMTSIDLGSSPMQETIGEVMPDELMETPEERSVIDDWTNLPEIIIV